MLGAAPYAVAVASLLAGASVVHDVYKPDLVREREGCAGVGRGRERWMEKHELL